MSDDTIPRVSLVDNVTEKLRFSILTGEIQPGEPIRVTALEKRFGVSHIPIREAVRRLETEGLIEAAPQRTAVAAGVALDDLDGLYDLRSLIEVQVVRRAVAAMTEADLRAIDEALERLEAAADDPQAPLFWRCHNEFHWAILEPGGTPWIRRTLEQLWFAAERYVRLFVSTFGSFEHAMEQHRQLVRACHARDADEVVAVLSDHLGQTQTTVREGFLKLQEPDAVGSSKRSA